MSKYVGARSHASQVAADHRSRIAAGNASRLAAAGLALFLTFGFGGVAQAASDQASDKASDKAQSVAANGSAGAAGAAGAAGTSTATGAGPAADAGPAAGAEQAAEKGAEQAADRAAAVVEISAVSSESAVSTLVVERTERGVTTTETTTTPVAETPAGTEPPAAVQSAPDPATAVALMAKTTNQPNTNAAGASSNAGGASSNAGGAGSNAGGSGSNADGQNGTGNGQGSNGNGQSGNGQGGTGNGQPDGGTYVETIVCHRDGVVLVIDDSGLNGHGADRFDHGHLEGVAECTDRDNDGVPDTVDADPDDSDNTEVVRNPVDECDDESMTTAATPSADGCDGDTDGDDAGAGCQESGESCTDEDDETKGDDEPDKIHPTVPGDKVEGPGTKGPGSWNNGGKAGGKKPKPEVLGEEGERPRGTKTPGKGGKTITADVDRTPGGGVPSQPEPTENDRARNGEVLGEAAERPSKNRPAALVLPQTGAASNMAAQAGAGLILVLGGLLTLRSRRRDSES